MGIASGEMPMSFVVVIIGITVYQEPVCLPGEYVSSGSKDTQYGYGIRKRLYHYPEKINNVYGIF
jgi:hypothetical protein